MKSNQNFSFSRGSHDRSARSVAALLAAGLLSAACAPVDTTTETTGDTSTGTGPENPGDAEKAYDQVLLGNRPALGLVTGGIYTDVEQPLSTSSDAFASELGRLGARWIRMEAGWFGTPPEVYRTIVQKAHAQGVKVLVVVPHGVVLTPGADPNLVCAKDDNPQSIDAFAAAYVQALDKLANETFVGALPDAWEILNEPNDSGCSTDGQRMGGNVVAWLLRRVWEWKSQKGRKELIVSPGVLATYFDASDQPWWKHYLGSTAWAAGPRPFDYFGIHPYDMFSYSRSCIESRKACDGSLATWSAQVKDRLTRLRTKVDQVTASQGTPMFVTEFGWQAKPDCGENDNCVNSTALTAAGMGAAMEAMRGVVEIALWYDYRNDPGGGFGLRSGWDAGAGRYPAKRDMWNTFATLAGGPGGNPDAAWGASPPVTPPNACKVDPEIVIDCGPAVGRPADQDDINDHCAYFSATQLTVAGKMYRYWKENGGLSVFGYPISPASCIPNPDANSTGQLFAQWFERQRMEYHPDNAGTKFEILLGRLGAERAQAPQGSPLDAPSNAFGTVGGPNDGSCVFFKETGHQLCGELARYYFYDGSQPGVTPRAGAPASKLSPLELLGYPVTEVFDTTCNGSPCSVQYTERARLEYQPQVADDKYKVLQGLLGNEIWRP